MNRFFMYERLSQKKLERTMPVVVNRFGIPSSLYKTDINDDYSVYGNGGEHIESLELVEENVKLLITSHHWRAISESANGGYYEQMDPIYSLSNTELETGMIIILKMVNTDIKLYVGACTRIGLGDQYCFKWEVSNIVGDL